MKAGPKKIIKRTGGFTLVELMVSVSVFIIIMTISMGSILSIFDANKKSQTLRAVMDNLNFSLEAMTRTIRFGTNYHCGVGGGNLSSPRDCPDNAVGEDSITVIGSDGDQYTYKLVGSQILRDVDRVVLPDSSNYPVTSSDVVIDDLKFRVFGSYPYTGGNLIQPLVVITIKGHSGTEATTQSSFSLQTSVSQRMFDSQ